MTVTLQSGEEAVIQLLPESPDLEPFHVAQKLLGAAVPDIKVIQDEKLEYDGMPVYWVSGKSWFDKARGKSAQTLVTAFDSWAGFCHPSHDSESLSLRASRTRLDPRLVSNLPVF